MIVFDASAVVSAALKEDSTPERALLHARMTDILALSDPVYAEMVDVLHRPRFSRSISAPRLYRILDLLRTDAAWFTPSERVTDCRDPADDIYLELALASAAHTIVSGDNDLLVLTPWRHVQILRPAQFLARNRPGPPTG